LVHGVTGSGKTTLAERISRTTSLPWYSVDDLMWEPGWVEVPLDDQRRKISAICAQDAWILDTAYGHWLDLPLSKVELIVALDYPRSVSLLRLVRRTVSRCCGRRTICNGNTESLRNVLSRDSIIRWHFRSFHKKRRRMQGWMSEEGGPRVLRLASPGQTEAWLAGLAAARSPTPGCHGAG